MTRLRLVAVALLVGARLASAELKPAALFSDHAVLQAGVEIPVWGWGDADREVSVQLGDGVAKTQAGGEGRWLAKLPAMEASEKPTEIVISSGAEKKVIRDVLIGEVWIGSGQSNMAFALRRSSDADAAIAAAEKPSIRLFTVKRAAKAQAALDVEGEWVVCSPKTVEGFSAVLYHFGRSVHEKLNVPVGLINSSWGGTPIQAWMPREAFANAEQIAKQHRRVAIDATQPAATRPQSRDHLEPMRLFNGMIAPLVPYAIRGVTWYQGENNVNQGEAGEYAGMLEAMVAAWRNKWNQGDWPFLFVQIAPYGKYKSSPDALPVMWEQQTQALTLIRNSGMAVTGDVGDAGDIHPKQKRVVGDRLAAIALARTYGRKDVKWQPPLVESVKEESDGVRVHFTTPVKQLGEEVTGFETSSGDGKFQKATAVVKDGDVIVKKKGPGELRFQWSPTAEPSLINDAGLPAVAFSKTLY